MKPVVTVDEMRAIDAESPVAERELVRRAGTAVYFAARNMLGGTYGRHVVVIEGRGNNGADGHVAAELLRRKGARITTVPAGDTVLPMSDLIIDAAYGTGFHGEYRAPDPHGVPVLAVDIPSGVDGDTGVACKGAVKARRTIAFAALKPGHLLHAGADHAGDIDVVDIGLDVSRARMHLLEQSDISLPPQPRESHKWETAVAIVGGSPGMLGSACLSAAGAARAGAGMVRLFIPGIDERDLPISEAVAEALPSTNWADVVLKISDRVKAIVVGPGLGRDQRTIGSVNELIAKATVPVVVDADGLFAIAQDPTAVQSRGGVTVLTPHDGEFKALTRRVPLAQRWQSAEQLSESMSATVLLKGSTSVIARVGHKTLLSNTGGPRLATAGTGDVYAGVLGAFLALGIGAQVAAAQAAFVHGKAAQMGHSVGFVAGDLPQYIADWLSSATIEGNG